MTSAIEQCCKPGITWQGSPSGQEAEIAGVSSYQTANFGSTDGPILMLICDIWGYQKKNIRLVADRFAELGYRAIVPDFFNGKFVKSEEHTRHEVMQFIQSNPISEKMQLCDEILEACKSNFEGLIGVLGFCWGAKCATLLSGQKKVAAAVLNHASLLNQEDVEGISKPCWFNFAGPDDPMINPDQRHTYEKILDSKPGCGYKYFPDQQHGWTLKGDDGDSEVQAAAEDAFNLAVSFFKSHIA